MENYIEELKENTFYCKCLDASLNLVDTIVDAVCESDYFDGEEVDEDELYDKCENMINNEDDLYWVWENMGHNDTELSDDEHDKFEHEFYYGSINDAMMKKLKNICYNN